MALISYSLIAIFFGYHIMLNNRCKLRAHQMIHSKIVVLRNSGENRSAILPS